jgi:hypothetical protein
LGFLPNVLIFFISKAAGYRLLFTDKICCTKIQIDCHQIVFCLVHEDVFLSQRDQLIEQDTFLQ